MLRVRSGGAVEAVTVTLLAAAGTGVRMALVGPSAAGGPDEAGFLQEEGMRSVRGGWVGPGGCGRRCSVEWTGVDGGTGAVESTVGEARGSRE